MHLRIRALSCFRVVSNSRLQYRVSVIVRCGSTRLCAFSRRGIRGIRRGIRGIRCIRGVRGIRCSNTHACIHAEGGGDVLVLVYCSRSRGTRSPRGPRGPRGSDSPSEAVENRKLQVDRSKVAS